jgi:hypothetical protein
MTPGFLHIEENRLALLLTKLGYTRAAGWISADAFTELTSHRFALQQARLEMNLLGAFCLMRPGEGGSVFSTPIVYVASAPSMAAAQEVHRKVWSQGLAPFLLVLTPEVTLLCPGFSYVQKDWAGTVKRFDWSAIDRLPGSPVIVTVLEEAARDLWDLRATRLRTSLFWRDHAIDVEGRVDRRLLDSLEALSLVLTNNKKVSRALSPAAANSLIGRFLYVFFLSDRGIINQAWITSRGHTTIDLNDQYVEWPAADTWAFFDDLDSIFNGSIFPLAADQRNEIDGSHVNLVRRVMKHGAEPLASGGIQLSFLDFYLGALRTETLSSVYEQFLENLQAGERRRSGAFYTPPFLVDFMLDRLEETIPLADGVTVLDPAAGSGVFLVGAYRRIIEKARWASPEFSLGLDELRGLLMRNIFGIERNRDACHVAAFSLYLTMLDYVDPRDLTRVAAGEAQEKLFPALLDSNLFPCDFFSDDIRSSALPAQVDCVVGNPPWQKIGKLNSPDAEQWRDQHRATSPIGHDQAAELFVWKAIQEHLSPTGTLALLIPTKSFINPTSWTFRRTLAQCHTIIGAANFGHLRHQLFANAKHAGMAVFMRARQPFPSDQSWVFSPLSVGQPLARKQRPWTIVFDRADVATLRHDQIARNPRGWLDAFMLRPIDHQIRLLLEDRAVIGEIATLEGLCTTLSAEVSRGGNPEETGVERSYLIDAPSEGLSEDEAQYDLLGEVGSSLDHILPVEQWNRVRPSYRFRFGGNVLLVPRNLKNIRVTKSPVGFTSSTMALFYKKPADQVSEREIVLLTAMSRYLRSEVALYLVATTGRRWLIDRRNIEPEDLKSLPVPITGLDDQRIDGILTASPQQLESYLLDCLGLDGDLRTAIEEFLRFRMGFRDGDVPLEALGAPTVHGLEAYLDVVSRTLDGLIGREQAFEVSALPDEALGVAAVSARFQSTGRVSASDHLPSLCQQALRSYEGSAANSFTDSLAITYSKATASVTVVKPLEYFRWTIDSAFSDSRHIMNAFVAGDA